MEQAEFGRNYSKIRVSSESMVYSSLTHFFFFLEKKSLIPVLLQVFKLRKVRACIFKEMKKEMCIARFIFNYHSVQCKNMCFDLFLLCDSLRFSYILFS